MEFPYRKQYANFIGGEWVEPLGGEYLFNVSPISGELFTIVPRSEEADVELALSAADSAKDTWGKTSPKERARLLNIIADRMENNLQRLAVAETIDNGKPLRETLASDIPIAIDYFRYFGECVQEPKGITSDVDSNTVAYQFHEPLGVVGQMLPWDFPLLAAARKLAPALAAGNCVVVKPAEQTPASLLVFVQLIQDLLPPGVLNVVNGVVAEACKSLASDTRLSRIELTSEAPLAALSLEYTGSNISPFSSEIVGKIPNVFFADVLERDDAFFAKALESFLTFALNQGEACTCPSLVLIEEKIYDRFMERALPRVAAIRQGHPLDLSTMIGAQVSQEQLEKIIKYIDIGKREHAECLIGGERNYLGGALANGYYVKPTVFRGHIGMRIFQEDAFGPVVSVATFKDEDEVIEIANAALYGHGASVWTRDAMRAYRFGRAIQAGRVWTNCYHGYPAHAVFGGRAQFGLDRESHMEMLRNYQRVKNVLVSYSEKPLGIF
ncbi:MULTISPECIES: aldehyde dehydrogenase family protein [unclassified Burkholderia]|uniref:aldehyde dehydrogenase family protein n=1 Tax=unclassified Burkholderia TaxID=2613784 RepID=UPI002AB04107|nr:MULTISPECIES: aldehyde dehydrogenase family protein [unclassified Burkholderia]